MTIDGKNYPVKLKSMSFKINFDFKKPTISQKRLKNNLKLLNKISLLTTLEKNVMVTNNKMILNDPLNLSEETIVQWI